MEDDSIELTLVQKPFAITFDSGGWTFPFGLGVAAFLQDNFMIDTISFGGTSAGASVATTLVLGIDIRSYFKDALEVYNYAWYNPFRMCNAVKTVLEKHSPEDILWQKASGRLRVGLSRGTFLWSKMEHYVEDSFDGKEHGIACIRASSHIPVIGGLIGYMVKGVRYFDGGLTKKIVDFVNNFDSIVISSWVMDTPGWIGPDLVLPRKWSFFPPKPAILKAIYRLGYLKAEEYFTKNKGWDSLRLKCPTQIPSDELLFGKDIATVRQMLFSVGATSQRIVASNRFVSNKFSFHPN